MDGPSPASFTYKGLPALSLSPTQQMTEEVEFLAAGKPMRPGREMREGATWKKICTDDSLLWQIFWQMLTLQRVAPSSFILATFGHFGLLRSRQKKSRIFLYLADNCGNKRFSISVTDLKSSWRLTRGGSFSFLHSSSPLGAARCLPHLTFVIFVCQRHLEALKL